jgi:hypothetical protein
VAVMSDEEVLRRVTEASSDASSTDFKPRRERRGCEDPPWWPSGPCGHPRGLA